MADPINTTAGVGLLGLAVIVAGPTLGPLGYVLFGATLGAFTALSASETERSNWRDAGFVLRVGLIATLFTAPAASWLAAKTDAPVEIVMGGLAYLIGWRWDWLAPRLLTLFARKTGVDGEPKP